MSQLTRAEEDHIKAVHSLAVTGKAFTKDIAERLHTKASSVTVMLKKLAEKRAGWERDESTRVGTVRVAG